MASSTDDQRDAGYQDPDRLLGPQSRLGTIVGGRYRITGLIGSGSSSHVFAAEHLLLGKHLAIKVLRSDLNLSPKAAQRFRREAKAIARLRNEHIVDVVDCGELDDQTPYLVMELLDGEDLRGLLRRELILPVRRAIQILVEACHGLTTVHEAGLVHRDLKPENLFITRLCTGEDRCQILDFGVAKMDASVSTAHGAIIGTVRYMAPEQLEDSNAVGPATDVYALGAILYECLTGRALCDAATVPEAMYQVMNREPTPISELCPQLPAALARIIQCSTAKSIAQRPQSAAELAALLEAARPGSLPDVTASGATLSDAGNVRVAAARRSPAAHRSLFALALLAAGTSGIALGRFTRGPSSSVPSRTVQLPSLEATARAAPATLPAIPEPASIATSEPMTSERTTSLRSIADGPATKPVRAQPREPSGGLPAEAPKPVSGRVGGFDTANPYGE
jgi:serine/threonine protein kinase